MQKKIVIRIVAGGIGLMALSGVAFAQSLAYTNQPVDVYAGPSGDYPMVAQVPPSAQLTVYGCVSDYSWCDVEAAGLRGWVYGGYLDYPYQGSEVPVMAYGVQIGLPVVAFSFGTYWDHLLSRPALVSRPGPLGESPAAYAGRSSAAWWSAGGGRSGYESAAGHARRPAAATPAPAGVRAWADAAAAGVLAWACAAARTHDGRSPGTGSHAPGRSIR